MDRVINVGPVYPPYQLDDFQRCPLYWDLTKRWKPPITKAWTAMVIGNAVAKGLEANIKGETKDDSHILAQKFAVDNYPERADRSLKGVVELTRQGVELGLQTQFSFKEVLSVEEPYGRTRPDLVAYDYDGALAVWDHKVKVDLDDKFYQKELNKYETSNQFFEYAWIVGAKFGEHVERVYAHIIILGPSPRTVLHPIKMTREHIRHWLHGASQDWHRMKAIEQGDAEAESRYTGCQTNYGPCAMHEGCHTFAGDEAAFPAIYERVTRGKYAR